MKIRGHPLLIRCWFSSSRKKIKFLEVALSMGYNKCGAWGFSLFFVLVKGVNNGEQDWELSISEKGDFHDDLADADMMVLPALHDMWPKPLDMVLCVQSYTCGKTIYYVISLPCFTSDVQRPWTSVICVYSVIPFSWKPSYMRVTFLTSVWSSGSARGGHLHNETTTGFLPVSFICECLNTRFYFLLIAKIHCSWYLNKLIRETRKTFLDLVIYQWNLN